MSIKAINGSGAWVFEQHGMIEPHEPGQGARGRWPQDRSYGTSSYGYDIWLKGREFKVFTNIHSTVVDPKNFDEKSFVDINADVCIIPPNSFAWRARWSTSASRNVLTVCLGKSTYALRDHRQRHALRARVGRLCDAGVQQTPRRCPPRSTREGCAQVLFFEHDEGLRDQLHGPRQYQGQRGDVDAALETRS